MKRKRKEERYIKRAREIQKAKETKRNMAKMEYPCSLDRF